MLTALATPAAALPIVSLDADPSLPGVQAQATVVAGAEAALDVVISGVPSGEPLVGFEFELRFDPTRLGAQRVEAGDFLPAALDLSTDLAPPDVAVVRLATGAGMAGGGVLARVVFLPTAQGLASFALQDLVLSRPGGAPSSADVQGSATWLVPEPVAVVLLGVFAIAARRRGLEGPTHV